MSASPVFIVGSPRSGTSILTSALLRAGYNGFYEGNFLSLITTIRRQVDRHFQTFYTANPKVLTSKIDQVELKSELACVLMRTVQALHMQSPWLDKTGGPEMIEAIPVLRTYFPTGRYVFAKRRAIENIVSRLIKFPQLTFEYHCLDWARTNAAWRKLKAASNLNDCIEIDQRSIATNPARVAEQIGSFLEIGQSGITMAASAFLSQRPQETEAGTSSRVLSLDSVNWSSDMIAVFHRICDEEMRLEGYSFNETYWSR